jgi:hypothetical protein
MDPTARPASQSWMRLFMKRFPNLYVKKTEPLEVQRKNAHDPQAIRKWFQEYEGVIRKCNLQRFDVWNFDETGFRIGWLGKTKVVISRANRKKRVRRTVLACIRVIHITELIANINIQVATPNPRNRKSVTSVECISATGRWIPSMIVAQGKVVLEGYAQNDLDGEAILGFSDTGLATPALIQAWLRKFNAKSFELSPSFRGFKLEEWFDTERNGMPGTTRRQPGRPAIYRMLLSDGYFSHLELPFIEFCAEYEIIPFCFPPHLTHLIQPLDVSVFEVFKHKHKISIENNVRHGNLDFSLFDFLEVFQSFHRESFSYHTILSGWRATGLDPKHISSSMVVGRLGSFLGRQKEKKGEMPVVEPPESLPRVQGVATAINGLRQVWNPFEQPFSTCVGADLYSSK